MTGESGVWAPPAGAWPPSMGRRAARRALGVGPRVGGWPPLAALRPCPFCGGRAELERSPWLEDCFRIACGSAACGVRPGTEYLMSCFAAELVEVWNRRPGAPA